MRFINYEEMSDPIIGLFLFSSSLLIVASVAITVFNLIRRYLNEKDDGSWKPR